MLLEQSYAIHLHIIFGYFCTTVAELSLCNRDYVTGKA